MEWMVLMGWWGINHQPLSFPMRAEQTAPPGLGLIQAKEFVQLLAASAFGDSGAASSSLRLGGRGQRAGFGAGR